MGLLETRTGNGFPVVPSAPYAQHVRDFERVSGYLASTAREIHPDTGLPVFPEDDVAFQKADIEQASWSGDAEILRRANIDLRGFGPGTKEAGDLRALLDLADIAIKEAAAALKVSVVPYGWGLARLDPYSPFIRNHDLVPVNHRLIQAVGNVVCSEELTAEQVAAINTRAADYKSAEHDSGVFMWDVSAGQCVAIDGEPILVDVEPRVAVDGYNPNAFGHLVNPF